MISIDEAERLEGFPVRATLRRWAKAGEIKAELEYRGSRQVWKVCPESIRQRLNKQGGVWERVVEDWTRQQANGFLTGRVISPRGIEANCYGMEKYWFYLGGEKASHRVSAEGLRQALSQVPVDHVKKSCHFAQRDQMYKAVASFLKFQGRTSEIAHLQAYKPRRFFPPRKTVLNRRDFEKLLKVNDAMPREDINRSITRTIILLAAMAGLRSAEIRALEVSHCDLANREILVYLGKGNKSRRVGMVPALHRQIEEWLSLRPKTRFKNLIVSKDGKPLDKRSVCRRIDRLAERAGVDVTMHGLRRSFATINIKEGMPLSIAQKLLGHSNVRTTQEYVMIDEQAAVDYLKSQKV